MQPVLRRPQGNLRISDPFYLVVCTIPIHIAYMPSTQTCSTCTASDEPTYTANKAKRSKLDWPSLDRNLQPGARKSIRFLIMPLRICIMRLECPLLETLLYICKSSETNTEDPRNVRRGLRLAFICLSISASPLRTQSNRFLSSQVVLADASCFNCLAWILTNRLKIVPFLLPSSLWYLERLASNHQNPLSYFPWSFEKTSESKASISTASPYNRFGTCSCAA